MRTLIIPCAGKSSRFPNMKPKWMLTHPDGSLMIQKALASVDLSKFSRVVITIVRKHAEQYDALTVLKQAFVNQKVEFCVLDDFTNSASETIVETIKKMQIEGAVVIKDSDNAVDFCIPSKDISAIVGIDLSLHSNISNIQGKSFLVVNEQSIILDIIEKQIVSNIACVGVYILSNVTQFLETYQKLREEHFDGELYISHVISKMISEEGVLFEYISAQKYEDWGTLNEWREVQKKCRTFFIDVDGVLMLNSSKYGSVNWSNNSCVLEENCKIIAELQKEGAQVVITTARPAKYRKDLENLLNRYGIFPHEIVMGLNHSSRVIVNDFSPTNPYPSAVAINIHRNGSLKDYLR